MVLLDGHTIADAEAHLAGEDAEMLCRFDAPRQVTLEEMRASIQRWIDGRAAGGPMFTYALRTPSRILMGGCELRWLSGGVANVSYWIFPQFRGRGYVPRAMALLWAAAAAIPGLAQIEAHVDADNTASRRVAERAGFVEDGIVVDQAWNGEKPTCIRYVRRVVPLRWDRGRRARCAAASAGTSWIVRNIDWLLTVSGVLICSMLTMTLAPRFAMRSTFGEIAEGPVVNLIARSWGAMIFVSGLMLIYAACHAEARLPILLYSIVGKAGFIVLVLAEPRFRKPNALILAGGDLVIVVLLSWYLALR